MRALWQVGITIGCLLGGVSLLAILAACLVYGMDRHIVRTSICDNPADSVGLYAFVLCLYKM